MRVDNLVHAIAADRAAGFAPFLVVGTAGTVDTGAVDDLDALADMPGRRSGSTWTGRLARWRRCRRR